MCHVSETHLPISYSMSLFLQSPHLSASLSLKSQIRSHTPSPPSVRFPDKPISETFSKMKKSLGNRLIGSESYWDADEMAVAEILVQLLDLIPAHDFSKPSFCWGAKRRRSAISQPQFNIPPAPHQPHPVAVTPGETPVTKSNAAASPTTPLMFSPSESSIFKRKNREELMQSFTDLTRQKDSLVKEMEAVKRHLNILRASNLELKNRKQATLHHHHHQLHHPHIQQQQQQQVFQYPAIQWSSSSFAPSSQSSQPAMGAGKRSNKMAPVDLPDLNLTLEESGSGCNVEAYQPSDALVMVMDYNVNRALASAQARKRRMQIYKEKNQNQILRQR